MIKITFIGAGSTIFAKNVLGDCLLCDLIKNDVEIALYDIDGERLSDSDLLINALNEKYNGGKAKIKSYLGVENRKEALRGADFVVNAIQVGGYEPCTVIDFEIPKKYGLRQTIADTLGIGGIFRCAAHNSRFKRFCGGYNAGMPRRLVFKLYKPHVHAVKLHAALHRRLKQWGFATAFRYAQKSF